MRSNHQSFIIPYMGNFIDFTGKRFGRWLATGRAANAGKHTQWWVTCDCGKIGIVSQTNLRSGASQSCGCLREETTCAKNYRHGMSGSRLFRIHSNTIQRCTNQKNPAYRYYGGKGVSVCNEWVGFAKFRQWSEASGYAENLTIDRINGAGNYEPSNCRWVTQRDQVRNRSVCLSTTQVTQIRNMIAEGDTNRDIAVLVGVPAKRVRRIRAGVTWL